MPNDPFSDVLQLTEARSVIAGGFTAGGTWAFRFPPPNEIKFSALVEGSCWFRLDGQKKATRFEAGDIALMPGRKGFTVSSAPDVVAKDARELFGSHGGGRLAKIGTGHECVALAGAVLLHAASAEVLTSVLAPLIVIRGDAPEAPTLRWIIEQISKETRDGGPGSEVAAAQLAQLLFVQILRAHLAGDGPLPSGWLRGLRDERIAAALRSIHGEPSRAWKLEDLAKSSGMSRTSFAVRFKAVVGAAPLEYLTTWRMRLAQKRLRDDDAAVYEIAQSLGYGSESAFSQAFKRVTGTRPRDYRRHATRG